MIETSVLEKSTNRRLTDLTTYDSTIKFQTTKFSGGVGFSDFSPKHFYPVANYFLVLKPGSRNDDEKSLSCTSLVPAPTHKINIGPRVEGKKLWYVLW